MTITIGAWIIPTFITIIAHLCAFGSAPKGRAGYFDFSGLVLLFYLAVAVIVSLIAWLAWALL